MKSRILIPLAAATVLLGAGVASAQMFGGGRGNPGFGRGGDVTVQIYSADPAAGALPIETLTLNRPLSPGEVIANYEGAAFVVVSGDSFSRTIDLAELAIEVQIYAEDPAAGAAPIVAATLVDGSGLRALIADTEGAAFVVVSGHDFTRTIDLSQAQAAAERFGPRGDRGEGFGDRRGPGLGDRGGPGFGDRDGPGFRGPGRVGPRGN